MMTIALRLFFLVVFPPFLIGVINKTKALFAGRKGAPFFQPYYDLAKLFGKGMVFSATTTWVFRAGPVVSLVAALVAGFLVPLGSISSPISFAGDFLLFAYVFALSRFFTTAAALDTGSPFEGMGSSREVTFAVLTEPALFFAFLVLARLSGSLTLDGMFASGLASAFSLGFAAPLVLVLVGLFIVLLAENCRVPVDDPTTHLELTMVHEAMILDHSGPLLALIEYGAAMKLLVFEALILDLAIPRAACPEWLVALSWAGGFVALSFIVGFIESAMARLRMQRVPALLISAILLCGAAFVMLVR
jgi:formate hydrogenlyase subunit 4